MRRNWDPAGRDRRAKRRYDLRLAIQFRISRSGKTSPWFTADMVDMSSSGVSFRCETTCPVGAYVEMLIDWPVQREDMNSLSVTATGVVVRNKRGRVAARFACRELQVRHTSEAMVASTY